MSDDFREDMRRRMRLVRASYVRPRIISLFQSNVCQAPDSKLIWPLDKLLTPIEARPSLRKYYEDNLYHQANASLCCRLPSRFFLRCNFKQLPDTVGTCGSCYCDSLFDSWFSMFGELGSCWSGDGHVSGNDLH